MRDGSRAGLVVGGVVVLYAALLVPGVRSLIPPGAEGADLTFIGLSLLPQIAYVLATAALLVTAGWVLADGTLALAGAVGTVFFYLLNPVTLDISVLPAVSAASQEAFFVLLFCVSWLWMRHWSAFMRSFALTILFATGLGLGAHSCFWIALALVPWVIFHRRPRVALGTLLAVTLGGSLIYAFLRVVLEGVHGRFIQWGPPFHSAVMHLRSLWLFPSFWFEHPAQAERHLVASTALVSFPWVVLALWAAGGRLWRMTRERRSDIESMIATLVVLSLGAAGGSAASGSLITSVMALATLVTLSAPLVAADLAQRDYVMSRPARIAALLGAGCAGLAAIIPGTARETVLLSAVAVLLAGTLVSVIPSLRRLGFERRWRSVLAGASVGACLVAAFLR